MNMPNTLMNTQRLREIVGAYGAQPARWPDGERKAAQIWLKQNPDKADSILEDAMSFDQVLDSAAHIPHDVSLLQARILKAAQNTKQDAKPNTAPANDRILGQAKPAALSYWKSIAATLIMATGLGFGIGQIAAADTNYMSAEALLALSMQSGYDELDLSGEGL